MIVEYHAVSSAWSQDMSEQKTNIPIATQWVLDAVGAAGRKTVTSAYMIVCNKTGSKGSGFLVDSSVIVTNEHVVRGCAATDVYVVSSMGERISVASLKTDATKDLAALTPAKTLADGLALAKNSNIDVGSLVRTWGYPLGYNGPAPLLSVGYLSGFRDNTTGSSGSVKHLVVNGAFNSGNSGGPLFAGNGNEVIGVVVNKALPLFTPFVQSAIQAFAQNPSGIVFNGADGNGKPVQMSESQVVAEIIRSLRDMAQVMIGEAIAVEELTTFLKSK